MGGNASAPKPFEEAATVGSPLVNRMRSSITHASLVLFALALLARSVQVQLVNRGMWAELAASHVDRADVAPLRGAILDANGDILVESRELVSFGLDPRGLDSTKQYGDARIVLRRGLTALGVREKLVKQALDTTRKWVAIPGLYAPSDVRELVQLRAVRSERVLKRFVRAPIGIQRIVGTVSSEQKPQGGLELEADSLLRGVSGRDEFVLDRRGRRIVSPALERVSAQPGHTITLTLNSTLQQIAERQLKLAMDSTGASGGDVVIMNPQDGSVLALAGARDGKPSANATALTEPYEPGSVMKPFLVARLIDRKLTTPDEVVNTEGGTWQVDKRVITDEHKAATMAVRDVIRLSSNIGVAKLSERLSPREEYEELRDFGFGTYTGVPYPAESRGRLPRPLKSDGWTAQTRAQLAMGYQITATAMQIAAAYSTFANGGELLQPALIGEIKDANGAVVFRHKRRVLRRVMSEQTANTMRTMLMSVVDSGTAVAAGLETYDVAGKSGTARRVVGRRYGAGTYSATFAAMFPAQAPQYVIVAKLIDPQGRKIFGGVVSGAMVHGILQDAQSTRDNSLNRQELAKYAKPLPIPVVKPRSPQAIAQAAKDSARLDSLRAPAPAPALPLAVAGRIVVDLPYKAPTAAQRSADSVRALAAVPAQPVPSVFGLNVRQAVRTLSAAGFQVRIAKGPVGQTLPAAGASARAGSTVLLYADP